MTVGDTATKFGSNEMGKDNSIEIAIRKLINGGVIDPSKLDGCTEEEVRRIEAKYGVTLPDLYRQFLLKMGKCAGGFLRGSDFLFDKILEMRKDAIDLLQDSNAEFTLENYQFVFLMHQGYQFLFLDTRIDDDPPVYYYLENELVPKKVYDHFSLWLFATVEDELQG